MENCQCNPLYKGKGLIRTSPSSYRPISLLSVSSNIVERAVQHQLLNFMETTNQMNYNNHAYRKNLSTTTAMLHLLDTIHRATDLNQITVLMTLDESSAFDCVSHDTLLRKLKIYNFSNETCQWISTYLKHRTNFVTVGAHKSEMRSINHGVPQGSVLGPLLYTLYTNELADVIKNDDCNHPNHTDDNLLFSSNCLNCGALPSYADDATYCYSSNSRQKNQDKLIANLQKIKIFLNNNSLTINESKTTLLELMVRQKLARINGTPPSILTKNEIGEDKLISAGTHIRLLGGNLQKSLSWQAHFETGERPLLKILRQKLGSLKHLGKVLPKKCRAILSTGIILSRINYLIQVWGGTEHKYLKRLQTILNATARFITGANKRTSMDWLMRECGWLRVKDLVILHSLCSMWKIVWLSKPLHLKLQISIDENLLLSTSPARLVITRRSYTWRTIQHWNALPDEIRYTGSILKFKSQVKKLLLTRRDNPG